MLQTNFTFRKSIWTFYMIILIQQNYFQVSGYIFKNVILSYCINQSYCIFFLRAFSIVKQYFNMTRFFFSETWLIHMYVQGEHRTRRGSK